MALLKQLANAGIISWNTPMNVLYDANSDQGRKQRRQKQLKHAVECLKQAEHKHRMADVLIQGDFISEAMQPLREAFKNSMHAFLHFADKANIKLTPAAMEKIAKEFKGPQWISHLYLELIVDEKENIDVKKLHQHHQLTLDYLYQMQKNA